MHLWYCCISVWITVFNGFKLRWPWRVLRTNCIKDQTSNQCDDRVGNTNTLHQIVFGAHKNIHSFIAINWFCFAYMWICGGEDIRKLSSVKNFQNEIQNNQVDFVHHSIKTELFVVFSHICNRKHKQTHIDADFVVVALLWFVRLNSSSISTGDITFRLILQHFHSHTSQIVLPK